MIPGFHLKREISASAMKRDLRRWAWGHPEWWSVSLSAGVWVAILIWPHHGMAHLHAHVTESLSLGSLGAIWCAEMRQWSLMVVAMMVPLVLFPVRITAVRSLWRRRHRAIAGFLAGYLALWLFLGAAFSIPICLLRSAGWYSNRWMAAFGFFLAAAWQFSSWKRIGLNSCHRTMPIAPRGWQADRDCVHYGWSIGCGCVLSCWALMSACLFAGHGILAMVCLTAVGLAERYQAKPSQMVICCGLSVFGLVYTAALFP
jgi:hypothetical protein